MYDRPEGPRFSETGSSLPGQDQINKHKVGWEDHFTPLTAAIQGEQSVMVQYLLEAGADPLVVDDHRENAFQAAARVNNPTILALLHPRRPR